MIPGAVAVDCPCCGNPIEVEVEPGEDPVYYPNDKAHPGAPPSIGALEGCECWDTLDFFVKKSNGQAGWDWYEDALWDRINADR